MALIQSKNVAGYAATSQVEMANFKARFEMKEAAN
jgi:hypothetical protein